MLQRIIRHLETRQALCTGCAQPRVLERGGRLRSARLQPPRSHLPRLLRLLARHDAHHPVRAEHHSIHVAGNFLSQDNSLLGISRACAGSNCSRRIAGDTAMPRWVQAPSGGAPLSQRRLAGFSGRHVLAAQGMMCTKVALVVGARRKDARLQPEDGPQRHVSERAAPCQRERAPGAARHLVQAQHVRKVAALRQVQGWSGFCAGAAHERV